MNANHPDKTDSAACESNAQNLSALADGELTGWTAFRLRRHLARCPACASELAGWQRLNASLLAADAAPSATRATFSANSTSTSLWHRRRLLVPALLSAAAAAGVVAFASFAPGQLGNPTLAYAEVSQAMQKVKTAQWTMRIINFDRTGAKDGELTDQVYEQLEPLRILHRTHDQSAADSNWGASSSNETSLTTPQETREYNSATGEIVVRPGSATNKREHLFQDQLSFLAVMTRESNQPKKAGRTVTTEMTTLDGRPVLCLTVKSPIFEDGRSRYEYRFWADAATKRVLRTEDKIITNSTGLVQTDVVTEGYRYDEPLSEKLFALDAPAGTPVYFYKRGDSHSPVTASERAQIAQLIAQTYKGLEHGDWRQFSAGWDFGFAASLPRSDVAPGQQEASLQRMVDASRGEDQTYDAKIGAIYRSTSVQIMGYGLANLPMGNKPLLAVRTTARILHKDGFDNGGGETFYVRTTGPNAPRIVGWQISFQREREADHKRWLKNGRHW